jgi:hypothetical protein
VNIYHFFTYNIVTNPSLAFRSSNVSIVVESAFAHATSVVHTVQVVVVLAPAHLLGRGSDGLHVVAEDALVEFRSFINLAVFVLG